MPTPSRTTALRAALLLCAIATPPATAAAQAPPDTSWDITKPRGKTREIDFTTSEGTWTSVDISRDGSFIVFDLLSHIYRMPASGGTATALTQNSGMASNFHPRISPDGTQAFVPSKQDNLLRGGGYGGPPFGGVVFTDDLSSMGAINQRYGVAEAVLRALQAGADVALWVSTGEVPAVLDRLESAVNSGELSAQRVEDSVTKLVGMKGTNPHC